MRYEYTNNTHQSLNPKPHPCFTSPRTHPHPPTMSGQSEGDPKEGQASCAHLQAPYKVTHTSTHITSLKEHTHNTHTHTHSHADAHIHILMHIHVHVHAHECVCRHVTVPCAWPSCACTLVYTTLRHSLFYQSPIPMPALPSSAPHCPALAPIIIHPHTIVRVGAGGLAWGSTPRKGHGGRGCCAI